MLCYGFAADALYKIESVQIKKLALDLVTKNFDQITIGEMNL